LKSESMHTTGASSHRDPNAVEAGAVVSSLDDAGRRAVERMRRAVPGCDPVAHLSDVHPTRIPRHVAIIMDGNGRWARERGFDRVFGHRNGARSVRDVVTECGKLGIEVLTLYSFSSENWKRPREETRALMELAVAYCRGEQEALVRQGVRFRVIGRREGLPRSVLDAIDELERATSGVRGPTLCVALNYGSRAEITDAVREIARKVSRGEVEPEDVDESMVSSHLSTAGLPDPDLLIRTAGEFRVSNFLLWQISYAELYVSDLYWPDFGAEALREAVRAYAGRRRRFGGLDLAGEEIYLGHPSGAGGGCASARAPDQASQTAHQ